MDLEPLKPLLESIVANWNPDSFDETILFVDSFAISDIPYVY